MANGIMGQKIHPKIVERIRELLRRGDLTVPKIAIRAGVSESQVRNIKDGRVSQTYKKSQPTVPDREYEALFGEGRPASTEPAPVKLKPSPKPSKPSQGKDLFAEAPASRYQSMTAELEREIIVDFRSHMPLTLVARKHRVALEEVELLSERVYWLAMPDSALRPCLLTKAEYLKTIGPKLTARDMEDLQPTIDRFEEMIMDFLSVDQPTAATIRKVTSLHHIEVGPPKMKPAPKPVATDTEVETLVVVKTLFSEIEDTVSDELEPLNALCLRFFRREPDGVTVDAWMNGQNDLGRKLETFEVDGELVTTEKHFREYFRFFRTA